MFRSSFEAFFILGKVNFSGCEGLVERVVGVFSYTIIVGSLGVSYFLGDIVNYYIHRWRAMLCSFT